MSVQDIGGDNHTIQNPPRNIYPLTAEFFVYPVEYSTNDYRIHTSYKYTSNNPTLINLLKKAKYSFPSQEKNFNIISRTHKKNELHSSYIYTQNLIYFWGKNIILLEETSTGKNNEIARMNVKDLIIISGSPKDILEIQSSSPNARELNSNRFKAIPVNSPNVGWALFNPVLDAFNAILKHAGLAERREVFPYVTLDNPLRQR